MLAMYVTVSSELTNSFYFKPLGAKCQNFICSVLDLPLVAKHESFRESKILEYPSKLYNIVGDGHSIYLCTLRVDLVSLHVSFDRLLL